MVFTPTNLFKGIPCPEGEKCALTSCVFGHELRPKQPQLSDASTISIGEPITTSQDEGHARGEPAAKRRKITYENLSSKPPSRAHKIRSELEAARKSAGATTTVKGDDRSLSNSLHEPSLPSLSRAVSPPPTNSSKATSPEVNNNKLPDNSNFDNSKLVNNVSQPPMKKSSQPSENLNPRLIPHDPAGHAKRSLYLKYLHAEIVRLNWNVRKSKDFEGKQDLVLSDAQLIAFALDEEEMLARGNPVVYANVAKNRIAYYKKMKDEEWAKQVRAKFLHDVARKAAAAGIKPAVVASADTGNKSKQIDTDLKPEEELLILPHLMTDQSRLTTHGYIPTPPTEDQATEAAAAVVASANYEVCDRCAARFQVFPDRNEEGLLTSNGPCKHHPAKKVFPQRTKGDTAMGHQKEPYHPCCNAVVGSPGCTDNEYHVFKTSSPARLAAVLPFITTPENASPAKDQKGGKVQAVSFDCEMGYTVYGLELIRLTAVTWPEGEALVDVLVRPLGAIIDLNSRFSGVWPETFANAVQYEEWVATPRPAPPDADTHVVNGTPPPPPPLPVVSSPDKARELLCSFLTPNTPLIGHAIDNDLNATRLCHPTIVDTVILFQHPRGLPMRFGLKMLSGKYLDRNIQTGGDRGHDSLEDARATGDLVRYQVRDKWRTLKAAGWSIADGKLVVPSPIRRAQEVGKASDEAAKAMVQKELNKSIEGSSAGAAGKKRRKKRPGVDGAGEESTEDEEVEALGNGVAAYLQKSGSEAGAKEYAS